MASNFKETVKVVSKYLLVGLCILTTFVTACVSIDSSHAFEVVMGVLSVLSSIGLGAWFIRVYGRGNQ